MRMRTWLAAAFSLAVFVSFAAAEGSLKETPCKCPVSGGPAKKAHAVAYKGAKVYFCCNNCPKAFAKDTKKFAAKANHQLAVTGQLAQVACPFSGKAVNEDTIVEVSEGVKVGFCCNNCKGKYEAAEDKVACAFGNISKGYTTQTKCPVSGKAIKAEHAVKHDGKNVYFCCGGCPDAFKKDPEKFASKLPKEEKEEK